MKGKRRKFSPQFKANGAIAAIQERYTLGELAEKFDGSPVMISRWKKEFLENSFKAFGEGKQPEEKSGKQGSHQNGTLISPPRTEPLLPVSESNQNHLHLDRALHHLQAI